MHEAPPPQEYLAFPRRLERELPKTLDVHLIVDNHATHKHAKVKQWLEKHPRFHVHFTPTSASWLNQVERFFAEISRKAIRRGTFTSVAELEATINHYLARHNEAPKPFKWTATAKDSLKKVDRARTTLSQIKAGTI